VATFSAGDPGTEGFASGFCPALRIPPAGAGSRAAQGLGWLAPTIGLVPMHLVPRGACDRVGSGGRSARAISKRSAGTLLPRLSAGVATAAASVCRAACCVAPKPRGARDGPRDRSCLPRMPSARASPPSRCWPSQIPGTGVGAPCRPAVHALRRRTASALQPAGALGWLALSMTN